MQTSDVKHKQNCHHNNHRKITRKETKIGTKRHQNWVTSGGGPRMLTIERIWTGTNNFLGDYAVPKDVKLPSNHNVG